MSAPGANVTPISGDQQSVFGQSLSCLGPIVVPVNIDMNAANTGIIDFSRLIDQNVIDFISGVYVDNKDGAQNINLVCDGTLMRYTVKANCQAFFQLMPVNPPKIIWSVTAPAAIIIPMYFGNIPWVPFNNQF